MTIQTKDRALRVGDVVKSPQFAYITYELERKENGEYVIDHQFGLHEIGYAANPMVYYDNSGERRVITHSAYCPELADHQFAVIAVQRVNGGVAKYLLSDLTAIGHKEYVMHLALHIDLTFIAENCHNG